MKQFTIPLPPPEGHSSDCLCEACFDRNTRPQEYSFNVLAGIVETTAPLLGIETTMWIMWLINSHLPCPLSEAKRDEIIKNISKQIQTYQKTTAIPKPRLFKGVQS